MGVGGKCLIGGCNLRQMYGSDVCYKHREMVPEPLPQAHISDEPSWWEEGGVDQRPVENVEHYDSTLEPGLESTHVEEDETKMSALGYLAGFAYVIFISNIILGSDGDMFQGGAGGELLAMIYFGPLVLIKRIFSKKVGHGVEETGDKHQAGSLSPHVDSGTQSSVTREQLIISTIAVLAGFLLPWGGGPMASLSGSVNGFQYLGEVPSNLGFWLGGDGFYWLSATERLGVILRSLLPLVFITTFMATWYRHLQGNDDFGRVASRVHLYLFGGWYALTFLSYGIITPSLEYNIGLYVAGISGLGLDPSIYESVKKYIGRPDD